MMKRLKQSDKKDRISRYRYSSKGFEQKYELIIDNRNDWLYNIDMASNDATEGLTMKDKMREQLALFGIMVEENDRYGMNAIYDKGKNVITYNPKKLTPKMIIEIMQYIIVEYK